MRYRGRVSRYPNLVSALATLAPDEAAHVEEHAWRMALAGVDLSAETWAHVLADLRRAQLAG